MIVLNGITFAEPSDLAIVSWNGDLYFNLKNPSTEAGVLLKCADLDARFSALGHDNHGQYLKGDYADYQIRWQSDSTFIVGKTAAPTSRLVCSNNGKVNLNGTSEITLLTGDTGFVTFKDMVSVRTQPANTGKNMYADGFLLHACTAASKIDKVAIGKPAEKLSRLHGITFVQNGRPGTGITFEDLESTELPGAVSRDEAGKPLGVNLLAVVPLLVEEIKLLRAEINTLKGVS